MRHLLPSLNALRAAEAVSRHGGISRAATELGVTPGAVSRQLSLLEAHFGCSLFIREQRGLVLSERGKRYFAEIGEAFDIIDQASDELTGKSQRANLSIQVWGTFGTEWLLPRLRQFGAAHPEIRVCLKARLKSVDFSTDDADAGIVLGSHYRSRKDIEHEDLYVPAFVPVLSRALAEQMGVPASPTDLSRYALLESQSSEIGWAHWLAVGLAMGGAADIEPEIKHLMENNNQVLRAIRLGVGVGLAQTMLVADDLLSGELVAPFDHAIRWPQTPYVLVWPKRRQKRQDIELFRAWIVSELRGHQAMVSASFPQFSYFDPV